MYLGLAAAPETWYNSSYTTHRCIFTKGDIMKKKFIFAAECGALLLSACSKEVENEPLEISLASENYAVEYTGLLKDGIPEGTAAFTGEEPDGSKWNGEGNFESGKLTDARVASFPMELEAAGQKYTGTFEGDVNGDCFSGTFTGMDGLVYQGDIINNCTSGKGKIEGIYSGDINNFAITGSGQFTSNDKAFIYEGGFEDGMLKGAGKLKDNAYLVNFSEVDRVGQYEGDTIDGLADGQGTFSAVNTYNEPYTYQGGWKQGLFHGYGSRILENEDLMDYTGNYIEGEYAPNAQEFFTSLGTSGSFPYTVTELADNFLSEHDQLFFEHNIDDYSSFLDEEFSFKKFEKNPAKFGDKLIDLKRLQVVQISEVKYSEYLPVVTTIIASNSNNIYWIYYIGGCDDVYAGSTIEAYLLPLGYGSYTTLLGTSRTAMAAAAAAIR